MKSKFKIGQTVICREDSNPEEKMGWAKGDIIKIIDIPDSGHYKYQAIIEFYPFFGALERIDRIDSFFIPIDKLGKLLYT